HRRLDIEIVVRLALVLPRKRTYVGAEATSGITLIEFLTVEAVGTADERYRVPGNALEEMRCHIGVIVSELAFRQSACCIDDAVRVRDGDAVQFGRAGVRIAGRCRSGF